MSDPLQGIPTGRLYEAQVAALARIHLFVTGEIHERMVEFTREARAILIRYAGREGQFDGASGYRAQSEIMKAWGDTQAETVRLTMAGMKAAERLPFALLAEEHQRRVRPVAQRFQERSGNPVFEGWVQLQLRLLLDQAQTRVLDGLNLSGRIWRNDREARDGINGLIIKAIADKQDAWSLAKDLEQYLGASQDCPRWTSNRLYNLSKKDIAEGDLVGLVTGRQCDGQGVAYKALRVARTEIQAIHDAATTAQLAASPWVLKERIVLSEGHPDPDICDDVAGGGEGGKGIYPVGDVTLPLHPQCLCYKVAVTMSDDEFAKQLRGWVRGESEWPEMDAYSRNISGGAGADLSQDAQLFGLLLFGAEQVLRKVIE